jgi:tripartite-type tricarboxylate transporter receptor subunit TctC
MNFTLPNAAKSGLAGLALLACGMSAATAFPPFPEEPITVIVPFALGGPADTAVRIVTKHMAATLGHPLKVQNVAGADVVRNVRDWQSKADGYTIMIGLVGAGGADQLVNAASQIQVGSIEAFSIAATAEGGLPEFEVSAWLALFAPRGISQEALGRLNDALGKALKDDRTRLQLLDLGSAMPGTAGRSPDTMLRLVEDEVAQWKRVLGAANH